MGLIEFALNPVRYVLGQTMRGVFAQEVRSNPIIVHAEAQADDVGTSGGGVGQGYDGTDSRGRGGFRPAKESRQGFKPQYVVRLRKPRNDIEAQRLYNHIRTLAFYLDAIPFLGRRLPFNIGIDSIIGLIPGIGDYIGLMISLYALILMGLFGLPITLLAMMSFNIILDCTLGLIPIVGDAIDVAFHANLRNLRLLEDHLIRQDGRCGAGQFQMIFPPSDVFMPKNGPLQNINNDSVPLTSRMAEPSGVIRKRAAKGESDSVFDGTQKQNWTWTEGDSPTMPGGGKIDNKSRFSDFHKGTMAMTKEGEMDQIEVGNQKSISAWSVTVVPTEIFTTMRYEPEGISVQEMCQPVLELLHGSILSMEEKDLNEQNQKVPLWSRHMRRLKDSVERMREVNEDDWKRCEVDEKVIWNEIQAHLEKLGASEDKKGRRMRIAVTNTGEVLITSSSLTKSPNKTEAEEPKLVRLDTVPIPIDYLKEFEWVSLGYKTGYRVMYDEARNRVKATLGMPIENKIEENHIQTPCFDVLLQGEMSNQDNFLTESSIANIIIVDKSNGTAITPAANIRFKGDSAHSPGLSPFLTGLMRQELIDRGLLHERTITVKNAKQLLQSGQGIMFLVNSLRGTIPVKWVD